MSDTNAVHILRQHQQQRPLASPQNSQQQSPRNSKPPPARKKSANIPSRGGPVIQVGGGALPKNIDRAEFFLMEKDPEIYQRGDMIVRPAREAIAIADQRQTHGMRLVPVKPMHLVERLTRI